MKCIYEDTRDLGIFKRESVAETVNHILTETTTVVNERTLSIINENAKAVDQAIFDHVIHTKGLTNVKLVCLMTIKRMEEIGYNPSQVKKLFGLKDKNITRARLVFESKLSKTCQSPVHSQLVELMMLKGD